VAEKRKKKEKFAQHKSTREDIMRRRKGNGRRRLRVRK
jgi:hypothetical protein